MNFQIEKNKSLKELLAIGQNENQRRLLYQWFKFHFFEMHTDYSITHRDIEQVGLQLPNVTKHKDRAAAFQMAEVLLEKAIIKEELSPIIVEGGFKIGEEDWGRYERRWRMSLGSWRFK